jgi:hypothetical protein
VPDFTSTESYGKPLPSNYEAENDFRFVMEFVEKSNAYRQPHLQAWPELLDNYLVNSYAAQQAASPRIGHPSIASFPSPRQQKRAILKDPETHQNTEALAAQKLGLIFGARDYISALPIGFDDYEKARVLSRIIMSVFEGPGVFQTMYQTFKDSDVVTAAVLEMGWEVRSRQQITEVMDVDDNGQLLGFHFEPREVVYREGPMIRQCDGWDFYPDPTGTRIQYDMMGVAKRFRITEAQAIALAESGRYDKAAVQRAADKHGHDKSLERAEGERFDAYSRSLPDKFNTMIGIEYWGFCPYKHADGFSNRVITILNGEIVRSTINPHQSGIIPFFEVISNPISGQFYGLPAAKANRFLQDSVDNMLMMLTDAADLMVRPSFLLGASFGGQPERVQNRGINDMIPCNNPEAMKEVPTNFQAISVAQQEHARRKMQMRESSGAINPVTDFPQNGDRTATETTERVRLASQRTELQCLLWERTIFPAMGRFTHSMLRQFADPEERGIAILNGERMPFSIRDIDFDADVRFVGSRQAMSRFQKNAAYDQAIISIGSAMNLIPVMPEVFIRKLRDGMDIPDADQIIGRAVAYIQQQQAAAAGALPGAASPPRNTEGNMGTETGAAEREGRMVA